LKVRLLFVDLHYRLIEMKAFSLLVALCGLVASEAVGAYYQSPYVYAPAAAAGYILPAYVPQYGAYGAYHVAPVAGSAYYGVQQDKTQQQTYEKPQDKYYYGGKFQGSCSNDGLYYKDDTTFVICSNGYASEQPCPPGTKTGGYPSYQAGYYYGYTDLCSVNLVDYGYGPSSYVSAPEKESTQAGYKEKSYAYDEKKEYNSYGKEAYSTSRSTSYTAAPAVDAYPAPKASYPTNNAYPSAPASYAPKNTYSAVARDAAGYEIKESYPSYPSANQYLSTVSSYTTKAAYQPVASSSYTSRNSYSPSSGGSNPYAPKDATYSAGSQAYPSNDLYDAKNTYQAKDTTYPSSYPSSYQSKDTSYQAKDTAYSPRDDYVKDTYSAKGAYPEKRY
jgi:hypothetical protein